MSTDLVYVKIGQGHFVLGPDQILGAQVNEHRKVQTTTQHSGRTTFGGDGIYRTTAGRSKEVAREITADVTLDFHFSAAPNMRPTALTIPFGTDAREAESFRLAILKSAEALPSRDSTNNGQHSELS